MNNKSRWSKWRPKLPPLLAIALVLGVGCSPRPGPLTINQNTKLLEEFRAWARTPLSVSPDHRKVAFSASQPGEPFGIEIRDVATHAKLRAMYSKQPILRVTWRPDGQVIAYFRQEPNTQRSLFFWNLKEDRHVRIETPVTHNQYEVKWAPDGRALAFTSDREKLVLASYHEINVISEPVRVFSWKADASMIVAVPEGKGVMSRLLFVDPRGGEVSRTAEFSGKADLIEVTWEGGLEVLCLGRDKKSNTREVFFVDPDRRDLTKKITVKTDFGSPVWTPDGAEIIWDRRGDRVWAGLIATDKEMTEKRAYEFPGDANFRGFASDGQAMIVSVVASGRNELLRVRWRDGGGREVLAKAATLPEQEVVHTAVNVPSPAGGDARLFISRLADPRREAHAAVIRVLGGAQPQYVTNWTERHFHISHGVTYVSVARRTDENVDDILQACAYVAEKYGISPARIVLYGQSSMAPPVIDALIKQPEAAGTFAVVGLISRPRTSAPRQFRPFRLMAFHGGSDPAPPSLARDILADAVGNEALVSPQVLWQVMPGEGHTLYEADAVVHASLLKAAGVP
jgi:Tol biopolymer transport system component/predicted esterase